MNINIMFMYSTCSKVIKYVSQLFLSIKIRKSTINLLTMISHTFDHIKKLKNF